MRIAQIAPLYESVPPALYGGTERVVSFLTEELVRQGHDVTLFASGDSRTRARHVRVAPLALRLDSNHPDPLIWHVLLLEEVRRRVETFDILHFHIDALHYPLMRALDAPTVTTLHGRLDLPDLQPLYAGFGDMPVVSISMAQRLPLPQARWIGNVHHGLPDHLLEFEPTPRGGYLAFLGRISPEKRPDRAIEIAVRAGVPLRIAAKVDPVDQAYFESRIRPLLDHPLVSFIGEIGDHEKSRFLGQARGLLFPIDWPEPFGIALIEAMACGTPVIAWNCGSVPEVVDDGVTGFIVGTLDEAVDAVGRVGMLDRRRVYRCFRERFSAGRMASDYVGVYERLLTLRASAGRPSLPVPMPEMVPAARAEARDPLNGLVREAVMNGVAGGGPTPMP
jgi:glycosyltransferase involved in cell wall biosynthesis